MNRQKISLNKARLLTGWLKRTGCSLALVAAALFPSEMDAATTPDLAGKTGWTAVMYGTNQDPQGDSQAGAADTDIVADSTHGSLYVGFSDGGTTITSDDYIYFRLRVDNPTDDSPATFSGVAVVGIDANLDGRIDMFLTVDGRSSSQVVRLMDPGTGANISPNTTTTTPLPTGWLANNGIYTFSTALYQAAAVSDITDPHWNGDNDLGNQGGPDIFVSWRIPMDDLATVLGIPSPVDRDGNYGPRGSTGISGYTKDTLSRYVAFTQTQSGPINGDLNGVGRTYDKNATFASLGAFTEPMSAANPVSASDAVTITDPVDANGYINSTEDDAVLIYGTIKPTNGWVMLTITNTTTSVTNWVQGTNGYWTNTVNVSAFSEGTITFTAQLVTNNGVVTVVENSSSDTASAIHDTVAPVIYVNPLSTTGKPIISGTNSGVPVGSIITVRITDAGISNLVTYSAVVQADGSWSVNTAIVAPTSGSMPSGGLSSTAIVVASGPDAAGNTGSYTALTTPTVNVQVSNDTTPSISGTWGGTNGGTDTLKVIVNGVTYTAGDGNLVVNGTSWTLTIPGGDALTTGLSPYDVTTRVTRTDSFGTVDYDNTVSDVVSIVSGPFVSITSLDTQATRRPVLSGDSSITNGVVIVRLDPNNDGNLTDAITYTVATDGNADWSLNTATAVPSIGSFPVAGYIGTLGVLVTATDDNGVTATVTQTLVTSVPTITISTIFTTATPDTTGWTNSDTVLNRREDDAITVTGTSTSATNQTVTVTVSDGDAGTTDPSGTATVQNDGTWTVSGLNLSALRNGYLTFTATVLTATAVNTAYTHEASIPLLRVTTQNPLDKNVGMTIRGVTDLTNGSSITVKLTPDSGTVPSDVTTIVTNGIWSATFSAFGANPAFATNIVSADVTATDAAGNKPATSITNIFNVGNFGTSQYISPITNAVRISTIAGDDIITSGEAGSVTISGTSSTNGTVQVTIARTDGTVLFGPLAATISSGTWSTAAQNLSSTTPNGPLVVTATLTNASSPQITYTAVALPTLLLGTVGAGSSSTISITTVGDGNISLGEHTSVIIAGTTTSVTNNATVNVTISDTNGLTADVTGTATVTATGTWTNTFNLSSLSDGPLTVSVSVTSTGTATDSVNVNHDSTAQALAITSGPSPSDSSPIISGTSGFPAGTILKVEVDTNNDGTPDLTYYATVDSDGTWSVDTGTQTPAIGTFPTGGIPSNSVVTVTGTDSAGNQSSISSASITSISDDNGVSNSDFITNDPLLTFNGRSAAGATVTLTLTNVSGTTIFSTTTTANGSGLWSYSYGSPLVSSNYTLVASVTSGAASATATQAITIDTVAPTASVIDIAGDTGPSATDFVTSDNTLVFTGTGGAANTSVSITLTNSSGTVIFSTAVTSDGSGNWTIDLTSTTLPDGVYTLVVVTTDSAGNTTVTTQTITIDTTAEITITNNATTGDTTPTITGTTDIETGRSIVIDVDFDGNGLYDDGPTYSFTNTVSAGGVWSVDITATLPVDTYNIRATGTDAAGNSATGTKILTVDTNVPSLTITEPIGDGNLNATEDNSVAIQGTSSFVPDGSTVSVSITDGATTIVDSTTVSGNAWSFSPFNLSLLDNGTITVTVTYMDAGGNIYSDTATVLHDKSGTTTIDGIGLDTATLSDFITKDTTLTFSGAAGGGSGSTVTLTLTNSAGQTVFTTNLVADVDGNWSFSYPSALTNDVYGLTATSGTSFTQAITVDTVVPTGPVTANSQTTTNTTPVITGTATVGPGETLTVTIDGVTYTEGDGNLVLTGSNWTLTIPAANALDPSTGNAGFDGEYTVTATVTDVAGNELTSTTTITITVSPTLTPATGGGAISADNFGTGTYVTLTGPIYTEGVSGDVGAGTVILRAPSGFEFNTGVTPTVLVTGSATASENINNVTSGSAITVSSITASLITLTVTEESVTTNTLTWQNVQVRPTAGTPLTNGNLTIDAASTGALTSVVNGTTSLGTLSTVPGALSGYRLSVASATVAAGSSDLLTVRRVDQYGNTLTNFTGNVTLTFSGPGSSPGGTAPTITDKDGNVVSLGSVPIAFTNGVSSLGGSLVPYKAETVTVDVTDGTYSTSTTGGSGVSLTVTEGAASAYRITAATTTPTAGADDLLTIRRVDQYGNTVTAPATTNIVMTFSGLGTSPAGNAPTVTDMGSTAIAQGSNTTIVFTNGVSSLGGTLKAYRVETATLHVSDGTLSSSGTGGTGVSLTVSAGAEDAYHITAAVSTQTAGTTNALTIRIVDTYGNSVTNFTGDRSLTFSGLGTSATGTIPTVTDKNTNAVNQGSLTTISFTNGVSSAGGDLVPYKAETGAVLHVGDGTNSSSDTGGSGATLTINDTGTATAYRITATTTTPNAGAANPLTIRLVDTYGNAVSSFTGDIGLTFTGLASVGGNTPTVTDKTPTPVNLGTATTISFTNGVSSAGGSLIAYKVETATLHATGGGRATTNSGGAGVTLTVSGGSATRLGFSTQPGKAEVGSAFLQQPVVQTQDAYGNPTTTGLAANLTVTAALTAGSGTNGTLGGQLSFDIGTAAGNGTVTFTNLIVTGTATNTAGSGNVLTVTASGFTDGVSSQFDLWTIYMASGDVIVADRGPYFSTGTILISRNADPTSAVIITSIKDPYEVARESDGHFVVVDYETTRGGGLFRIDRLTFAVSNLSSGGDFKVPFGVKVETKAPNAGKIIVADLDAFSMAGGVFRVDPVTGTQTTLTSGGNFYFLQGLAIAPTNTPNGGDIYVTSVGNGTSITSKLIKIDPATGAQTVISADDNFDYPVGVAVESDGNLIVVDARAKMVIRVNPATGVQTIVSDASNAGQGTPFLLPTHVAIDAAGDLYVSDGKVNAGANERLLFKVNKTTGNRVLITQDGFFEQPRGLELIP